ncbi:hypothetical protein DLAC_00726 [Tieghemostelium lacteum]|uniref:Uncharacterized protein n=1 Tax=Tieghemostelium lacteum TaxID=361077 RepID=A0A152A6W2_TIELA|nr:hypothetical protein DLAC_00726 [Tieghemostelium lacteum]|eukprot:KYR01936.1 hypothetical protein DLAC_00726 [Tieghemostelium lacteum]
MSDAEQESTPPSVKKLLGNFQKEDSKTNVGSPSTERKIGGSGSSFRTSSTNSLGGSSGSIGKPTHQNITDTSSITKEKSGAVVEKFLKEEILPSGRAPGSVHRSAINKPPPNENDNKASKINKFTGNPHPVYQLMLAGKNFESSTTKKKIVIPPSSAY